MSSEVQNSEVMTRHKFLPLFMEGLTEEIIRKAAVELNETPERKREALEELRRLIKAEKELQPLMDENFLLGFLRAKKFNPEVAFKTLRNYYIFKARYRGTLSHIYPSDLKHLIEMNVASVQPYRDREGSILFLVNMANVDFNKTSFDELIIGTILIAEYCLQWEATQISGGVAIYNFKGVSLRQLHQIASPALIYRFLKAFQDCIPIRMKAIHIINEPLYFSILFTIVKRFLSQKLKERIQFHGSNFEDLHRQVPPEILPSDFGGQLDPLSSEVVKEQFLVADSYFSQLYKYGYEENRAESIRRRKTSSTS